MDATQRIGDSVFESDGEESEGESENRKGRPLAKLCILKNEHIPESELPLYLGDNVLGRDPSICSLPLAAPSISKQHATICISAYSRRGRHSEMDIEALVWDVGSMNGTRKGRLKLTPNVRYALSDGDSLVVADIPCHFFSCAVKQEDLGTPVSKNSRVRDRLPEASGGKGGDKISGSKCVTKEAKTTASLTKTPVSASCLSFEQTPIQPQGTLVPDSGSESEDERWGRRTKGLKGLSSDSDSHKSSPTCSTFLSPANKIVPESEDESPVTPLSTNKKILYKDVSKSSEESGVDLGLQDLQKEAAAMDREEEKETVIPVAIESDMNDQHVSAQPERNIHLTGHDHLLVHTPDVSTNPITAFHMDSDTDVEEEDEGSASAGPVTLISNQVNRPSDADQFHLDSDTDVDEDEEALNKAPKTVSLSDNLFKSHIQPSENAVDSATDVDEDSAVSDAAKTVKPMKTCVADATPSMQQNDFCLHSHSGVNEEEGKKCTENKSSSNIHTTLNINSVSPDSTNAGPHNLHIDSDTDDEAEPIPTLSEAPAPSTSQKLSPTAGTGADLADLSDSDTDVEADSPLVAPVAVTTLSVCSTNMSEALHSVSDADTDVDEPMASPTGNVHHLADHRVDSGKDVEHKEVEEGRIPNLGEKQTPGFLIPPVQNCSTPVQVSGAAALAVALSSCSDSQEEEDFVVAETQSFVLQTRHCQGNPSDNHNSNSINAFGLEPSDEEIDEASSNRRSFHLGLSDSSHIQSQNYALATESTQAFGLVDRNLNLEETQSYASNTTIDTAAENVTNSEATQAYGVEEDTARCMSLLEKESQVNFALEATQAYISEPHSDSENETQDSSEETQLLDCPTSSTLAMAETQPVSGFMEEEGFSVNRSVTESVSSRTPENLEGKEEHVEVAQPQEQYFGKVLSLAETQPIAACDNEDTEITISTSSHINTVQENTAEESSEEDSVPLVRKRRSKPLQLEETQPLSSLERQSVEPALEDSDDEDLIRGPRKRKAKPLQLEETQPLSSLERQSVEPALEDRDSDGEDLIQGPQKRKAKTLQLEEEWMQTLTSSEVPVAETQPMATTWNGDSDVEPDDEKSPTLRNPEIPAVEIQQMFNHRKRKMKPLQLEDTQPLSSSGVSLIDTQPMASCEDKEIITEHLICAVDTLECVSGDKDSFNGESISAPGKNQTEVLQPLQEKPRTIPNLEVSEARTREDDVGNLSGMGQQLKDQQAKCSDPSKRQKRGKTVKNLNERKAQEEKQRIETERRELEESLQKKKTEQEHQLVLEREEREKVDKEKEAPEKQENNEDVNMLKVPTRGRRAAKKTVTQLEQVSNDDVPAKRTRSRSNSSNSVSSERSVSSINSQASRGKGRGREVKRTSDMPPAASARSSNRRRTVAAETMPQHSNDILPLSRSNSSTSLNSEISGCSESTQTRGRGGRQRGRGRKTELNLIPPVNSQEVQNTPPKPPARGRRSSTAAARATATTRGQQQASAISSEPEAAEEQVQSNQEAHATKELPLSKRNVRGRGQKTAKTVEKPSVNDGDETNHKRMGRKREMAPNTEDDVSSSSNNCSLEKAKTTEAAEEKGTDATEVENKDQPKRRGRASNTQSKMNTTEPPPEKKVKEERENLELEPVERRARGAAQKKMKETQESKIGTTVSSMSAETNMASPQPRTPTSVSRKRQTPVDGPVAKTPRSSRSSSTSPAATGQPHVASQAYKVLFTGVVDEAGERVLTRLGGSMAKGVADMNCLVTDKVRRTVKFLCAVAKGIPIVTTHWLEKCGKAGRFLSPEDFVVKDPEQEKKFSFSLQESLRTGSNQPLLQGFEIHVTKSVKPEPVQMKDIISCSGASFLSKMPSSHKPNTVVISCEEDWPLCGPAVSAALPVVTAEFILTGILQQKVDFQTHTLSPPATNPQPAGGKGRGRKKT